MPAATDGAAVYRPCLLLAHGDAAYAAGAARRFRRMGWDVYLARAGDEARRLARMLEPELIVLDVGLAEESGWLTCAKLRRERPELRIVLVGPGTLRNHELAAFVGACALVGPAEALTPLVGLAAAVPHARAG